LKAIERRLFNKTLHFSTNRVNSIDETLTIKSAPIYLCKETLKPTIMNKAELIDAISAEAGLSKADAKRALDSTIDVVSKSLKKGDRVALVGFGSFSISKRAARKGRNPQTGKEIKIAAKKVVKFKAGAELAEKVN
jgi:DNA-binding protein HU-beta